MSQNHHRMPAVVPDSGINGRGSDPARTSQRTRQTERAEKHAQRKRDCIELRRSGLTFDEIAQQLEISQPHATRLFRAAILDTYRRPAEEQRELELLRTDGLVKRWWADLLSPDGKVAERASNQLRWILPYRADLLGLKVTKVDMRASGGITIPADNEVWQMLQKYRQRALAEDQGVIEAEPVEAEPKAIGNGSEPDA